MLAELEQGVAFWRDESMALTRRLTEAKAQLGNAVGAVIDSGGYCEGPHDVADAIYRLTAERDALEAELDERRAMPYRTQADQEFFDAEWERTKAWMKVALDATRAVSAVGGAPGVSETHTDPKEAP